MHWLKTFAIVSTKHKYNKFNFNVFRKNINKTLFWALHIFSATYSKCLSNIVCWYKSCIMRILFCETWISVESLMNTHPNWFHRFFAKLQKFWLNVVSEWYWILQGWQNLFLRKNVLQYRPQKNLIYIYPDSDEHPVKPLKCLSLGLNSIQSHGISLYIRNMLSWDSYANCKDSYLMKLWNVDKKILLRNAPGVRIS